MSDYLDNEAWNTFDDVLILPQYSDIRSRSDCRTHVAPYARYLEEEIHFELPIMSANMDTITSYAMANAMDECGGIGIIHRYMNTTELLDVNTNLKAYERFFSVGTVDNDKERIDLLIDMSQLSSNCRIHLCVDIAHGHSINMKDTIEYIRGKGFKNLLIGGNVATRTGTKDLMSWGCDLVKIGIGPGAVCTTRTKTGVGVPQFEAIKNCAEVDGAQIIADGGFKHIGDFAKAIGAGALFCMTGSFFAGTDATPNWREEDQFLHYRGMASPEARKAFNGKFSNAEGISTSVINKGPGSTLEVCKSIEEGLKSAMSYVGALDIIEFQAKCKFIKVTPSVTYENSTRL